MNRRPAYIKKMFQQSIDDVNPRLITLVVFLGNCYSWMGCGWSQLSQLIKIKEEKKQQLCNYFESGPARLTRNHFGLVSPVKAQLFSSFYFLKALFTSYKHTYTLKERKRLGRPSGCMDMEVREG
jgi:hypothetical protein